VPGLVGAVPGGNVVPVAGGTVPVAIVPVGAVVPGGAVITVDGVAGGRVVTVQRKAHIFTIIG